MNGELVFLGLAERVLVRNGSCEMTNSEHVRQLLRKSSRQEIQSSIKGSEHSNCTRKYTADLALGIECLRRSVLRLAADPSKNLCISAARSATLRNNPATLLRHAHRHAQRVRMDVAAGGGFDGRAVEGFELGFAVLEVVDGEIVLFGFDEQVGPLAGGLAAEGLAAEEVGAGLFQLGVLDAVRHQAGDLLEIGRASCREKV